MLVALFLRKVAGKIGQGRRRGCCGETVPAHTIEWWTVPDWVVLTQKKIPKTWEILCLTLVVGGSEFQSASRFQSVLPNRRYHTKPSVRRLQRGSDSSSCPTWLAEDALGPYTKTGDRWVRSAAFRKDWQS